MARVIDRTQNPLLGGVPEGRGGLDLRYLLTINDRSQLHSIPRLITRSIVTAKIR
jgi:hypothetical protein